MKRRLLPLAPLPLLLALGAWASTRAADRAAVAAAEALALLAPLAREESAPQPELEAPIPTELGSVEGPVVASPGSAAALAGATSKAKKRGKAVTPNAPRVLFVGQEQVLKLASSGARPRGVLVAATPARPPGLKLAGVAALGIGLQDGDVLTRAVGQPALSSGAVIQAVLAARARRAPVLDGEFWRGAERWVLRVEQPYLQERHAAADDDPQEKAREETVPTPTMAVTVSGLTRSESSPRFRAP